jgi:hypothetical protein
MTKAMQGVLAGAAFFALAAATASAQTIGSADIIDGSIQAIDIAPETITTGRILNGTIQAIDLAPETITTGRIKNETIQAIDIAPESITTGRILNRTIKAIDIATESITTGEIKNGTIDGVDMADGTITTAKIANGAVTAAKLGDDVLAPGLDGRIVIGGPSLVTENPNAGVIIHSLNGHYAWSDGSSTACGVAQLQLPHLAMLTSLTVGVRDAHATASVRVSLRRGDRFAAAEDELAAVTTFPDIQSGDLTLVDDMIDNPVVDLDQFHYYVLACFTAEGAAHVRFYSAEVAYE